MARVAVIGGEQGIAERVITRLRESPVVADCRRDLEAPLDTAVYLAHRAAPSLVEAQAVFDRCAGSGIARVVLVSSAAVYGPGPHNPGLMSESRPVSLNGHNRIAAVWSELERLAQTAFSGRPDAKLTILRPAAVLVGGGTDYFSRLLSGRLAITLPGHDPSIQLLSPDDLAGAIRRAVECSAGGIYNVAPGGVIPLRAALRLTGSKRLPVPRTWQGLAGRSDQLDYIRFSWTISGEKIKRELGFAPARSSAQALQEFSGAAGPEPAPEFDDFGMDEKYIQAYGRTLMRFLHDYYWRVELKGVDHVPRHGRAVLVGMHRGFMPLDGVMALHAIVKGLGRFPRFLIHPSLVRFPFLFNFITKLGGILACFENAQYVLERDELLGVFPEGIRGAFTMYRNAYRLGKFSRDDFVKMALRYRAPIVPFVTVGSAEIFPILGRIDWGWWKRWTEWPFFPITPTFPLLPAPLPSKWHTQFLTPIHVERRYPPEAADDAATVRAISQEVRNTMAEAIAAMLRRRKSIFFGEIFAER